MRGIGRAGPRSRNDAGDPTCGKCGHRFGSLIEADASNARAGSLRLERQACDQLVMVTRAHVVTNTVMVRLVRIAERCICNPDGRPTLPSAHAPAARPRMA